MCESAEIRYVHYMSHPDYPETLSVGCVCAEHMEGDYVRPRLRERALRKKARRRKSWGQREWRTSLAGNAYLNVHGFNLTVFKRGKRGGMHWAVKVTHRETDRTQFGRQSYRSEADAKAAALSALLWAQKNLILRKPSASME